MMISDICVAMEVTGKVPATGQGTASSASDGLGFLAMLLEGLRAGVSPEVSGAAGLEAAGTATGEEASAADAVQQLLSLLDEAGVDVEALLAEANIHPEELTEEVAASVLAAMLVQPSQAGVKAPVQPATPESSVPRVPARPAHGQLAAVREDTGAARLADKLLALAKSQPGAAEAVREWITKQPQAQPAESRGIPVDTAIRLLQGLDARGLAQASDTAAAGKSAQPGGAFPAAALPGHVVPDIGTTQPPPAVATLETVEVAVVRGVRFLAVEGGHTFTVRLVPASLGELRVDVTQSDEGLAVRLGSANPAVRAVLEGQLPALRQMLAQSGLEVNGMTVASNDMPREGFPGRQPGQPSYPGGPASGNHDSGHGHPDPGDRRGGRPTRHDGTLSVFV
jgi:hypothetical protein